MRPLPDPQVCEQARLSRDPRFDGLFFTAVTSTRIYCRPVCPVPTVKREHVRYYPSAVAAESEGFRPCLICRPELAPGAWRRGDEVLARVLALIDEGLLAEQGVGELSAKVALSERQLRRLFAERLGVSPQSVRATRRLLFAKQLLTETSLSITDVALEAGFGSLRRFNDSFRKAYRMAPSQLRRHRQHAAGEPLTLRLAYRPPYDLDQVLEDLRARALPGVEAVEDRCYLRVFGPADAPGWLRVGAWPDGEHALKLELHCPQSVRILKVVARLRRMFDLDADPESIHTALARDERLRPLVERWRGIRLAGDWSGFEAAVRVVIERLARTGAGPLIARLVRQYGARLETPLPPALHRLFPAAEALANVTPATLAAMGAPAAVGAAVPALARAYLEGRVDFRAERTLEDLVAHWSTLPCVDAAAAHAIALRSLGHPDAFPADESILRAFGNGNGTPKPAALEAYAARWRPWRAYAAHLLRLDSIWQPHGGSEPLRQYRGFG